MGDYELLSKIKSPADVKRLDEKDLAKLCSEIREKLIETVSLNGGHLSPNLGVVELTVALHRTFNFILSLFNFCFCYINRHSLGWMIRI